MKHRRSRERRHALSGRLRVIARDSAQKADAGFARFAQANVLNSQTPIIFCVELVVPVGISSPSKIRTTPLLVAWQATGGKPGFSTISVQMWNSYSTCRSVRVLSDANATYTAPKAASADANPAIAVITFRIIVKRLLMTHCVASKLGDASTVGAFFPTGGPQPSSWQPRHCLYAGGS
jgi:hypothetical protein